VEDLTGDDFYAVQPYAFYFMPEWDHPERQLYCTGVVWCLIRQHVRNPRRLLLSRFLDRHCSGTLHAACGVTTAVLPLQESRRPHAVAVEF